MVGYYPEFQEDLDAVRSLRVVAPGTDLYVKKLKYVRAQLGLGLKETKDLIDMTLALTADEIVERYQKARGSGVYVQEDKLTTRGFFLWSNEFPEVQGFHRELSLWIKQLIQQHPSAIAVEELVLKKEVMEQIGLMAHMKSA